MGPGAQLLLVQPDGASIVHAALTAMRYEVRQFDATAEAAQFIEHQRKPALALLDLALAGPEKFIGICLSRHIPLVGIAERPAVELAERSAGVAAFVYTAHPDLGAQLAVALQRARAAVPADVAEPENLRERAALLQSVLDNIPVMIAVYGPDGDIRLFNRALERLSGWSTDELHRMDILAAVYPDPEYRRGVLEYMQAAVPGWRDIVMTTRTGDRLESSWANIRLPDGTHIGIGLDIRSRKAHEDRLLELNDELDAALQRWRDAYDEAERRRRNFESLAENSPDMVVRFDRALRFLYANRALERITGIARDALIGHASSDVGLLGQNAVFWQEKLNAAFASGEPEQFEFTFAASEGESVYDCYLIPEYGLDGQVESVMTVARDVTERVSAERALRRANEQLEQTLSALRDTQDRLVATEKRAAIGTLAAGVANELSNPLMGAMGYVDYVLRNPDRPDCGEKLARAGRELERMRHIMQDVLSFVLPVEEPVADVTLADLCQTVFRQIHDEFAALGIELSCRFDTELPSVHAKTAHLQQVLLNLLRNARDAVRDRPERRVTVRGWKSGDQLCVEVADTGHGIPKALAHRIFDPFFTTRDTGTGAGLGLSISRNIVEDLGGELTFDSEEGKGSRFLVRLPI